MQGNIVVISLALVVVLLIIILIHLYVKRERFSVRATREVPSRLDGREYRVHTSFPDYAMAADAIARVNARTVDLLRVMKKKRAEYAQADAASINATGERDPHALMIDNMLSRYDFDVVAENSPYNTEGETSFTLDKGKLIALCLRDSSGRLHDDDILFFVKMHELAHVSVNVLEHPPEFWSAFAWILGVARDAGLYKPVDYSRQPIEYCGMTVKYNPLFG